MAILGLVGAVIFIVVVILASVRLVRIARRHQLARLALLAPDAYIFTFDSNAGYQRAIVELKRQEIIDPKAPDDDSRPLARGPRWISATVQAIRIMRGYDLVPVVELPWTVIGDISSEEHQRRGSRSGPASAVTIWVRSSEVTIPVVLYSPADDERLPGSLKQARRVATRLQAIRVSPSGARVI